MTILKNTIILLTETTCIATSDVNFVDCDIRYFHFFDYAKILISHENGNLDDKSLISHIPKIANSMTYPDKELLVKFLLTNPKLATIVW